MFRIFFVAVALLLTGCGKSKKECAQEAGELGSMMREMDSRRRIPTPHVKLVLRADLVASDASDAFDWPVELSSEGTHTRGASEAPGPAENAVAGIQALERDGRGLLLAIDALTPWSRVVEVLDVVEKAGASEVTLVFARPPIVHAQPARSAIDDRLDAIEKDPPADRATEFAKIAEEVVRDCEAVNTVFSSVGSSNDTTRAIISGLPPALIECNCKCDRAAMKSMMWRLLHNPNPTSTLRLSFGGEALALPAVTTWEVASKSLGPAVKTLRARVAKP